MPRTSRTELPFLPGVFKDDTASASKGYFNDSDGLRWHRRKWQTWGGWERASEDLFTGIVRGAHAFSDRSDDRILAFGTAANLMSYYGGEINDITPEKSGVTLTNPFKMVNGSATVQVTDPKHGLKGGDLVTYFFADAVGGITIDGQYTVRKLLNNDSYEIEHSSAATSDGEGGGFVDITVPFDVGNIDGISGFGYGTIGYGDGDYGVTTEGDVNARAWNIASWGDWIVACPELGALYEWAPFASFSNLVANGDFAADDGWETGAGWTISGGVATATAGTESDLQQNLLGVDGWHGGFAFELTFTVDVTAGAFQFRVVSEPTGSAGTEVLLGTTISKSGTYTRTFITPASPTFIQFAKNDTFAGTLSNVSITPIAKAYRMHDAPQYNRCMAVDGSNRVIVGGTVDLVNSYNSMMVRWSDPENNKTWLPDTDNGAGFNVLAHGSKIMAIVPGKSSNTVFTDSAIYTMRPTSTGYDFQPVTTSVGLKAKHAVVESNGSFFFWGSDDMFYIFQGGEPIAIECPIRDDVMDNLAGSQQSKIYTSANSQFQEIYWHYPDGRISGECNTIVVYNWGAQCWYTHKIGRTTSVPKGIFDHQIMFGDDGSIYSHDIGNSANGDALSWYGVTAAYDFGQGDNIFQLAAVIPDFEEQIGAISFEISGRDGMQGPWVLIDTLTARVGEPNPLWTHGAARQMQFKISGNSSPARARFGRIPVEVSATGARR